VAAVALVVLVASVVMIANRGFPQRLSPAALSFDAAALAESADQNPCHRGPPSPGRLCALVAPQSARAHVLVWGDSHANAIAPALAELGRARDVAVTQASYSGCPPFLGMRVSHVPASGACPAFDAYVLPEIRERGITRVLLAAYWTAYLPAQPEPPLARWLDPYRRSDYLGGGDARQNTRNFAAGLERTVRALEGMGVEVWILRQVPTQRVLVPLALSRAASRGIEYADIGITLQDYRLSQSKADVIFAGLGERVHSIDPAAGLCASGICRCSSGGEALYIDANHLSPGGARFIEPQLAALFH
jgi:hypothetical protein